MKFIKVGRKVVNLGLVAWAEMGDDQHLSVHFCVPKATTLSGVAHSTASGPPVAVDHYVERFAGAEAEHLWDAMLGERGSAL